MNSRKTNPSIEVDHFNAQHKPGTPVEVTMDDKSIRETKTRSEAWVMGGHTAMIMLEGISGGFMLSRVRPIKQPTQSPQQI